MMKQVSTKFSKPNSMTFDNFFTTFLGSLLPFFQACFKIIISLANWLNLIETLRHQPVGRAVTRSSLEREVRGSNLGPVKSDTMLPMARHCCDISLKGAVLLRRKDAEMGPANSLHASAY